MLHGYLQAPRLVLIFHCTYVLHRLVCVLGMVLAKGMLVTLICHACLVLCLGIDLSSIQGRLSIAFSTFFAGGYLRAIYNLYTFSLQKQKQKS